MVRERKEELVMKVVVVELFVIVSVGEESVRLAKVHAEREAVVLEDIWMRVDGNGVSIEVVEGVIDNLVRVSVASVEEMSGTLS